MLNNPKPLGKKGGSNSYNDAASNKNDNTSPKIKQLKVNPKGGQPPADNMMPPIKDAGYTVKADDGDDSEQDYYGIYAPLEDQINQLHDCIHDLWQELKSNQSSTDSAHRRLDDVGDEMYKHTQGHLPPAKSSSQMQKMLEKLGLDDDYQAMPKQTVYASDGSVKHISVTFIPRT